MKASSLIKTLAALVPLTALGASAVHAHEEKGKAAALPQAASAEEALANAQSAFKAIQTAAAAKQFDAIHDEQEKLAGWLKQVQEKGTSTDKARFEGAVKNAIAASDRVHVAADAKDAGKLDSSMRALEATMAMVEKHLAVPK